MTENTCGCAKEFVFCQRGYVLWHEIRTAIAALPVDLGDDGAFRAAWRVLAVRQRRYAAHRDGAREEAP